MAEPKEKRKVYITWESGVDSWRETYQVGDVIRLPENPTRNGYDFKGWWTKPREGGEELSEDMVVEGNETYFARWEIIHHKVVLLAVIPEGDEIDQEDIETIAEIEVPHGSTIDSIPDVERLGCDFLGWWYEQTEGEGGKMIQLDEDYRIVSDMVFHAHFNPIKYRLELNTNGGRFPNAVVNQYTITMTPYVLPTPYKEGHRLLKWYVTDDPDKTPVYEIPRYSTGDLSYAAEWEIGTFKVDFCTVNPVVVVKTLEVEWKTPIIQVDAHALDEPTEYISAGQDFLGWYRSKNPSAAEQSVDGSWYPDEDTTLYAVVKTKEYTVTRHQSWDNQNVSQTVNHNGRLSANFVADPPANAKPGWRFIGWWTSPNGGQRITSDTRIVSSIDIYDVWQDDSKIPVTLDAASGYFDWMTIMYQYGDKISYLDLPTPSRVGWTFDGWHWTKKSGESGVLDENNTEPIDVDEDMRLYARWTSDNKTLTFHSNGGQLTKIDG